MWKNNSLSIVLSVLTLVFVTGQILTGLQVHNQELLEHGAGPLGVLQYLQSGHFVSALFENWESEFLQMGMYVVLTVKLRQRGSAESRAPEPGEDTAQIQPGPTPWPVRRGGVWLRVYAHSLSFAFAALFLASFALHLDGSWRAALAERALRGEPPIPMSAHLFSAQFWFESFQNWQSEFLAVLMLVVLTIWLRERDSPQSKPVAAPHSQTGA